MDDANLITHSRQKLEVLFYRCDVLEHAASHLWGHVLLGGRQIDALVRILCPTAEVKAVVVCVRLSLCSLLILLL